LIGCSGIEATPAIYAVAPSTTKASIEIVYSNGTGDSRTNDYDITALSCPLTINPPVGKTGTFSITWIGGNITVTKTSGLGTSTANICEFSGGMTLNYNSVIQNYDNVVNNYSNSFNYYDSTTQNFFA